MTTNKFGSLDIYFDYTPGTSWIQLVTNITGVAAYEEAIVFYPISIDVLSFEQDSSTWIQCRTRIDDEIIDDSSYSTGCPIISIFKIRICFGEKYLSVYCNSKMIYQYSFLDIDYPNIVVSSLKANGDIELDNVVNSELSERRDAVFVDYEATTSSAIESVIQQRPIQVIPAIDRAMQFTYRAIKDIVDGHHISEYRENERDNSGLSSDGIVYYADVGVSISEATAKEVGFITRLYRLSDLNSNAIKAVAVIQERSLEKRNEILITTRLDPRIETLDNLVIDLYVTGTNTHLLDDVIIEDIQITISDGQYQLRLTCRRNK